MLSSPNIVDQVSSDTAVRVRAEFREMPDLRLTVPQAARLFNLGRPVCERVLTSLVVSGELSADGGAFSPVSLGRRSA